MCASYFRAVLLLLGLLISASRCGAENPAWNNLKQLSPGQRVHVVLTSKQSIKGQFQSVTDDALIIRADRADQTLSRSNVQRVSSRRRGHLLRNTLIGGAIGVGAGLGVGAAIDNDCSSKSIVCTGNKGKAILTPAFGFVGACIGVLLSPGGWKEIYREK